MKKILYIFFILMLLSPVLSYLTTIYRNLPVHYYFQLTTTFVGFTWLALNIKNMKFPVYGYPMILYIIYLMIWATFNGDIERRGWLNYLLNNINIQILLMVIMIYNTQFTEKFIKGTFLVIKVTLILAFIFSLIQLVYKPFFFTPQSVIDDTYAASIYEVRRSSIFGYVDRNAYGLVFLPLVAVFLSHQLVRKEKYALLLAMAGIVAFATNTRYVMAGFVILLILILISKRMNIANIFKWLILGTVVLIVMVQVFELLGYDFVEFYNQRLFKEGSIEGTTRFLAFQMFLRFFPEYWLFGNGVHLSTEIASEIGGRSSQIHIGYLSHLVSFGIIGSLFLFTFWFLLARDLFKTAKKTNFYGGFFAFLVFFWANATLVYYSIFTYGLIFALIYTQYYKQEYETEQLELTQPETESG